MPASDRDRGASARIPVLFVIGTLDIGGAETQLVEMVRHLDRRFEPVVCCLAAPGPLAARLEEAGVPVITIGLRRPKRGYWRLLPAAVRMPFDLARFAQCVRRQRPLIVQGVAGAGKTTVALHRITWLLYTYQQTMSPENLMVIAPSPLFLNYICAVLPELGAENVLQTTFAGLAELLTGRKLPKLDDSGTLLKLLDLPEEERGPVERVARLKGSLAMKDCLQRWFAATGHPSARDPYFLYAASNAGSLLGLLGYPLLIEPRLALAEQQWVFAGAVTAYLVLVAVCAATVIGRRHDACATANDEKPPEPASPGSDPSLHLPPASAPTTRRIARWVLLAALPSSLYWFPTTVPGVVPLLTELAGGGTRTSAILFGEVYGSKVQSLAYGQAGTLGFVAFDAMADGRYLDVDEFAALCARHGVPTAPELYRGPFSVEAIRSGIIYGFASQVDGMVRRIREELGGSAATIATGGLAEHIVPFTTTIDHVDDLLTLHGLKLLHERNSG